MENGQNGSGSVLDVSLVSSLDQNELRSLQEVMVRRMKNRERQRRYRARKRLEADRKKTDYPQQLLLPEGDAVKATSPEEINHHGVSRRKKETSITHFTPIQIEVPVTSTPVDFVPRVHSQRDWKRDARRAHLIKEQNGKDGGIQAQTSSLGTKDQSSEDRSHSSLAILDSNQERSVSHGRRNWKEEARNKKN